MRRRGTVLAVAGLAVALTATGCVGSGGGDAAGTARLEGFQLISFDACDEVLDWVKAAALERVGPYGFDGFGVGGGFAGGGRAVAEDGVASVAAPSSPAAPTTMPATVDQAASAPVGDEAAMSAPGGGVSGTNTVEAGVDEADLVKTDGQRIVAIAGGRLQVISPGGGSPSVLGSMELPLDAPADRLLLRGDRALLIGSSYGVRPLARSSGITLDGATPGMAPTGDVGKLVLREVDISDPAAMSVTATLEVEGALVDTRVVEGTARVVVRSTPAGLDFVYPSGPSAEDRAAELNRSIIEDSTIDDWLPSFALDAAGQLSTGRAVACDQVHHPAEFSGFSLLSVLTLDLDAGLTPGAGAGVIADGQRVYASPENLYVALDRYEGVPEVVPAAAAREPALATTVPGAAPKASTAIHKFSISGAEPAVYLASGTVEGLLLDDFAMSEHEGVLRVATTVGSAWWGGATETSESFVTTLGQDGERLVQLGQVGGMGLGEQIFGVRFLGPVGYVVTFRQTDPLYTLDLADPANPAVRGELEILGYSAYLHPLGDGRLLGVGQDATEEGRRTGAQVSLFDVSDLSNPQRLSQLTLPEGWTSAEPDRHAFLWWAPAGLAVLPVDQPLGADRSSYEVFSGVVGIGVDGDQLSERGRFGHPAAEPACGPLPEPRLAPAEEPAASAGEVASSSADEPTTAAAAVAPAATSAAVAPTPPASDGLTSDGLASIPPDLGSYPWCGPSQPSVTRSLVIDDVLFTLSNAGLQANDVHTLATLGWVAFA